MTVFVTVEIAIPPGPKGEYPLNQKLWQKLVLPEGWQKRPMYKHSKTITLKCRVETIEAARVVETIQEVESKLLLIRNM